MKSKGFLFNVVLVLAAAALLVGGCATTKDTISQAEKTEKDRPSFAETRAIAEEGFIYGLPIVMNYAVMYDYVIDKDSPSRTAFSEVK